MILLLYFSSFLSFRLISFFFSFVPPFFLHNFNTLVHGGRDDSEMLHLITTVTVLHYRRARPSNRTGVLPSEASIDINCTCYIISYNNIRCIRLHGELLFFVVVFSCSINTLFLHSLCFLYLYFNLQKLTLSVYSHTFLFW